MASINKYSEFSMMLHSVQRDSATECSIKPFDEQIADSSSSQAVEDIKIKAFQMPEETPSDLTSELSVVTKLTANVTMDECSEIDEEKALAR